MHNRVQYLPPEVYRKLLILDPPPKEVKRVAFTDLNEVRTFRQSEPPSAVSGKTETQLLREQIRRLERKIERLSQDKENRQMHPLAQVKTFSIPPVPDEVIQPSTPGTPGTAMSVVSPYRPVNRAPEWTAPDTMPLHPPANVRRALVETPQPPARALPQPPAQPQAPQVEPKPSRAKRFVLALGALAALGVVPGLVSIVVLGPAGLGVAAGMAALSIGLIALGSRMK